MGTRSWHVLDFPSVTDPSTGSLGFVEAETHVPYPIQRVFYLYGLSEDAVRGGHAHHALHQTLMAITGSFTVALDDGRKTQDIVLDSPTRGLHVVPPVWLELRNFSPGAICLVFCSDLYDPSDYIPDREEFLRLVEGRP